MRQIDGHSSSGKIITVREEITVFFLAFIVIDENVSAEIFFIELAGYGDRQQHIAGKRQTVIVIAAHVVPFSHSLEFILVIKPVRRFHLVDGHLGFQIGIEGLYLDGLLSGSSEPSPVAEAKNAENDRRDEN